MSPSTGRPAPSGAGGLWVGFADFDPAYNAIGPGEGAGVGGRSVVRAGDTLSGIAAATWGDASRWYLIAEANGLGGNGPQGALAAGTSIVIPGGSAATNLFNTADTFKPYDPARALGDVQPNAPAPPRGDNGCGAFGAILLAVVAVAVTLIALPAGPVSIGQGILAGLAGGAASNAVGLATGIQESVDWKGIALAGIGGGVTAALGPATGFFANALRAAAASAITQGIGVATGLQDKFSWAGVAAAGVGGGVGGEVAGRLGASASSFGGRLATSTAAGLANAATRSVIDGTDFGDNILAALPDVIGQTVGGWAAGEIAGSSRSGSGRGSGGSNDVIARLNEIADSQLAVGPLDNAALLASVPMLGGGSVSSASGVRHGRGIVIFEPVADHVLPPTDGTLAPRSTEFRDTLRVATLDQWDIDHWQAIRTDREAPGIMRPGDQDAFDARRMRRAELVALDAFAKDVVLNDLRMANAPLDLAMSAVAIVQGKGGAGDWLSVGSTVLPGAKVLQVERSMARAVRLGREGERAAGIVGAKSGVIINGRTRFPDEVTLTTVREVKNVARQGWTRQLKDYADLAKRDGKTFELWVRENTILSSRLEAASRRGEVLINRGLPGR